MQNTFLIAFAMLVFAHSPDVQTTAGPLAHERWQRMILPAAGHAATEQCVVLDAEVFAHAAPGLRDLRLLQGNRELPYAVDESHDDRETGATMPADDRSIFDVVGMASFLEPGAGDLPSSVPIHSRTAFFSLPAHVPVERVTLRGGLDHSADVLVRATPYPSFVGPSGRWLPTEAEIVPLQADAGRLSLPVTLGANLQHMARVTVTVTPASRLLTGVVFEMRRRELCYQPIADAPVRIIYGDPNAELIHYDYALHYRPTATPVLATLGPREMNPAYKPPLFVQTFTLTLRQKLGLATGLCVGMLAATLGALFGMRR